MGKTVRVLFGLAVTTSLVATACSDASRPFATAPDRVGASSQALLGGLLDPVLDPVTSLLVAPVQRTTPLAENVVWTFTAGPYGATSSNSAVGLKVTVPYGALTSTQTITVTALAGSAVAYRFEPHLEFARKVTLTQSLVGTNAGGLLGSVTLYGAHFPGDEPEITSGGLAIVDELVGASINLLTMKASWGVKHFTGWILASGYEGETQ